MLSNKSRYDQLSKKRGKQFDDNQTNQFSLEKLLEHAQYIRTHPAAESLDAIQYFRKVLTIENKPPIDEVIQTGLIPHFVYLLEMDDNPTIQFEVAWILTNVTSGSAAQTEVVVGYNAIPAFLRLLSSKEERVQEQSVWALGNIAGDRADFRDTILTGGAMRMILDIMSQPHCGESFMKNATWCISNLCRNKDERNPYQMVKPFLHEIISLLYKDINEVVMDTCWTLSFITEADKSQVDDVLKLNILPRLMEIIDSRNPVLQTPALRTIGNIVAGNDEQTQACIDAKIMPRLCLLLDSENTNLKKEAAWAISNIAAGKPEQIQLILDFELVEVLMQYIESSTVEVKKECAWAICNGICGGDLHQVFEFCKRNAVKGICKTLVPTYDVKLLRMCIEALSRVFEVGNMLKSKLQFDSNPFIHQFSQFNGFDAVEQLMYLPPEKTIPGLEKFVATHFGFVDDGNVSV